MMETEVEVVLFWRGCCGKHVLEGRRKKGSYKYTCERLDEAVVESFEANA